MTNPLVAHPGEDLVLARTDVAFPGACVLCGSAEGIQSRSQSFSYQPGWVVFLLFIPGINIVWFLIAVLFFTDSVTYELSECSGCRTDKVRSASAFGWGFLFAILGSIGLGFVVRGTPWILGSAAMLVAALVIGGVASRARAPIRLIHLDRKTATLRGVHPNVARALREAR
jgi:hypothetical protein